MKRTNKDIKFPYYSGNIEWSKVIGHVTLEQFIKAHKNPKPETLKTLMQIKKARRAGDDKLKRTLKQQLKSFTPSVFLGVGQKRRYVNVKSFTGLMQLDFDKLPDLQSTLELRQHLFDMYPEMVCAYISPSEVGFKALMKIEIDTNPTLCEKDGEFEKELELYRAFHKALITSFEQYGYFDEATRNAILPLFLSADKGILYRNYEDCPAWKEQDWSVEIYVNLNETITPEKMGDSADYNFNKVLRIITERINLISGNGHPQVRTASLILGSRVGAGYLTMNEAEQMIENLIKANQYLAKGIRGYINTSVWGIKNGMRNPKYF